MTNDNDRPAIYTVESAAAGESVDCVGYPEHRRVVLAVNEEHTQLTVPQAREVLMALIVALGDADADR